MLVSDTSDTTNTQPIINETEHISCIHCAGHLLLKESRILRMFLISPPETIMLYGLSLQKFVIHS